MDDEPSLLVSYVEAQRIVGADVLDQALADGRIRAFPLNDKPGAASMFVRSAVARLAGRSR